MAKIGIAPIPAEFRSASLPDALTELQRNYQAIVSQIRFRMPRGWMTQPTAQTFVITNDHKKSCYLGEKWCDEHEIKLTWEARELVKKGWWGLANSKYKTIKIAPIKPDIGGSSHDIPRNDVPSVLWHEIAHIYFKHYDGLPRNQEEFEAEMVSGLINGALGIDYASDRVVPYLRQKRYFRSISGLDKIARISEKRVLNAVTNILQEVL